MSWLKKLGGSVVEGFAGGVIGSLFGGINSANSAKVNMNADKGLWDYQTKNQYQNMVYDLNKAGINPMLAVGGLSSSAGGSVGGSPAGADTSSISNATAQKAQLRIVEKQAQAQVNKSKAEAKQAEAAAALAEAQTETENVMRSIVSSRGIAETDKLYKEIDKISADIEIGFREIEATEKLTSAQVHNFVANIKSLLSTANLNEAETQQVLQDVNSLEKKYRRDWMNTEPGRDIYKMVDILKTIFGAVGAAAIFTGKAAGKISFPQ